MCDNRHNAKPGDLAEQPSSLEGPSASEPHEPSKLTHREQAVLNLLIQGQANKEIAAVLCISQKTVEFHLTKIYAKLGVKNRAQAIAKAIELGLGKN